MKIRSRQSSKVELMMTPMIDIVFQLLIFFIMSFKIAAAEGDFSIKMPLAKPSPGPAVDDIPPLKVRITAGPDGSMTGISMNDQSFSSFRQLHSHIIQLVGPETGPSSFRAKAEVELDCDFDLKYQYVVQAITNISGHVDSNGNIVKLIEKIKFAPPRAQQ